MWNKSQAKEKWHLTDREVKAICDYYSFPIVKGAYQIPEDTVPIYIPDKRCMKSELRQYLFVADAIHKKVTIVPELINSSVQEIRTAVRVLKNKHLIELIEGREIDSLDYRDYMLGIDYLGWKKDATDNLKTLKEVLGTAIEAGAKGVTSAMLEHYSM